MPRYEIVYVDDGVERTIGGYSSLAEIKEIADQLRGFEDVRIVDTFSGEVWTLPKLESFVYLSKEVEKHEHL